MIIFKCLLLGIAVLGYIGFILAVYYNETSSKRAAKMQSKRDYFASGRR